MAQWRNSTAGELSLRSPTLCPPDLEKGFWGWAVLGRGAWSLRPKPRQLTESLGEIWSGLLGPRDWCLEISCVGLGSLGLPQAWDLRVLEPGVVSGQAWGLGVLRA